VLCGFDPCFVRYLVMSSVTFLFYFSYLISWVYRLVKKKSRIHTHGGGGDSRQCPKGAENMGRERKEENAKEKGEGKTQNKGEI
jgi:hypothetical protein